MSTASIVVEKVTDLLEQPLAAEGGGSTSLSFSSVSPSYPAGAVAPCGQYADQLDIDLHWMRHALVLARQSGEEGEVPVGAVLVLGGQCLAVAGNRTMTYCDPTAHAEILVLRQAANRVSNHRLLETTLYVTLQPCSMCLGAMLHARIKRLVFAAYDQQSGGGPDLSQAGRRANHQFLVSDGLLAQESAELLKEFFLQRRSKAGRSVLDGEN